MMSTVMIPYACKIKYKARKDGGDDEISYGRFDQLWSVYCSNRPRTGKKQRFITPQHSSAFERKIVKFQGHRQEMQNPGLSEQASRRTGHHPEKAEITNGRKNPAIGR